MPDPLPQWALRAARLWWTGSPDPLPGLVGDGRDQPLLRRGHRQVGELARIIVAEHDAAEAEQ